MRKGRGRLFVCVLVCWRKVGSSCLFSELRWSRDKFVHKYPGSLASNLSTDWETCQWCMPWLQIEIYPGSLASNLSTDWETCHWCMPWLQIEIPVLVWTAECAQVVPCVRFEVVPSCCLLYLDRDACCALTCLMFPSWVSAKPSLGDIAAGSTWYCTLLCSHCEIGIILSLTNIGSTWVLWGDILPCQKYWDNVFEIWRYFIFRGASERMKPSRKHQIPQRDWSTQSCRFQ